MYIKYIIVFNLLMFTYNSFARGPTINDSVLQGGPPVVTLSNASGSQVNSLNGGETLLKPSNACAHFCGQSNRMIHLGQPTAKGVEVGSDGQVYACGYLGCTKYSRYLKNPATGMFELTDIDIATLVSLGGCLRLDSTTNACLGKSGVTYIGSTCTPTGIVGQTCTQSSSQSYPWLDAGSSR